MDEPPNEQPPRSSEPVGEWNIDADEDGHYHRSGDEWFICPPGRRTAVKLSPGHTVTEHDDGTITITPSLGYSTPGRADHWHGYLEAGQFREA